MIDKKDSDERDEISKNDEENIIEDIEIMKLQNLSSQNIYISLEKESDDITPRGMSDNKDSDERDEISKNDEVKVSDITEDLKVGKCISHKYVDNVETKSDKRDLVDISDDRDSAKRDDIGKNDEEKLTDVDEESEEIYQIE